jgi:DNA topoisomerase-3
VAKALVVTEKPSVARDIAAVLGGMTEHDGWWEGEDYVVTFAVGHLFELLEPEEIDERFKRWTLDVLPIIPDRFELKKKKGQSDRIRTIKKLAERQDVDRIVNACDAGREGELIFREIVRFLGVDKPIERLWLQSMTPAAIRQGFGRLLPGRELEGLARAAECRAYSDWLIGMNATRALTKRLKTRKERGAWSAGRVQTPTLALLVERELEVLAHVPEPFWRVKAVFEHEGQRYDADWFDPAFEAGADPQRRDDRLFDEARANAIVEAVRGARGEAGETRKPSRESAPPLFDLTSLQREANRRFGWSARRTLGAAQRCYEAHKILTYPRTDSRCLPDDYRATVDEVLGRLSDAASAPAPASEVVVLADYAASAQRLGEQGLENTGRIFDDAGVSDHFAIVPTGELPPASISGDDARLFDLVVRRFLGAFHPPAVWERVERTTEVAGESFRTRARTLVEPGWRAVLPGGEGDDVAALPPLVPGENEASGVAVTNREAEAQREETKPPPRISEARLLSLMENAGQQVEDEDLAAVLHEKGLGTPATRADIIENLIQKGYAVRQGKALRPTVKGIRLIDTLRRIHIDRLASAALTGEIEQHLGQVHQGRRSAEDFMVEMKDYARDIVHRAKTFEYEEVYGDDPPLGPCPACGRPVYESAFFYRCLPTPGVSLEDDCPMRIWKDTSGRYIDRGTAESLLKDHRTGVIDGFTARNGRTYRGHLEIDTDDWRVRVVSEGWNEEAANDQPEYDVNDEPLGPCPFAAADEACRVIETPTHFICTTRLAAEEEMAAFREAKRKAREKGEPAPEKPEKPPHEGFVLPRTVCKREITRDEALHYLREGRTELLEDFTSRFGRPFSATLVLKDNGRHGFEFPPRKKAGASAGDDAKGGASRKTGGRKAGTTGKSGRKATTRKKTAAKTTRKKTTRKKTAAKKTTRKKAARKKAKPSRAPRGEGPGTRRGRGRSGEE